MQWLTKAGDVIEAPYSIVESNAEQQGGSGIVAFDTWRERPADAGFAGFHVAGNTPEHEVGAWLRGAEVLAVYIPKFTDGRAYSLASALRMRHSYRGQLVAFGDVQQDQLQALARVGFDAFVLPAGVDLHAAARGLTTFSVAYQKSSDASVPVFRLRTLVAAREGHA
jgi:uncharacterized protein (DUF934 family)